MSDAMTLATQAASADPKNRQFADLPKDLKSKTN
jgi:hypothetical protein